MSRSWERMVQKNSKSINNRRRKEGKDAIGSTSKVKPDRYQGRNYYVPALLLLLILFYVVMLQPWREPKAGEPTPDLTMTWVTVGCYVLLAVFYWFRRPYLAVTRDTLETRKFSGYKRLGPADIRKIVLMPGYVTVETVKGANWVFSRMMTRYPTEQMGERLKVFSEVNHIELEIKEK
ncbi:hypothetical protein ACFPVX_01930 [Cohnella faecalis]|uniref:Uncharacterized protein n=1 Tax=Cohnella faecalis TaxID=2315694 RepID=A0A398CRJ1_9BACL|nr:hypothetical protein [Cohnella faecalis]RIE04770.1 hypothetical protein D3H35_04645 [Cohnella faecalis]